MLMAYLYCKHWNMQSDINTLHTYALGLSSKDPNTFDPLWVFAYEALDATELKGDWVAGVLCAVSDRLPFDLFGTLGNRCDFSWNHLLSFFHATCRGKSA